MKTRNEKRSAASLSKTRTKAVTLDGGGHRKRLYERYDRSGLNGFSEHEILECLLFFAIPRRDTKPLAKSLLKTFHDLPGVFAAPRERLIEEGGLGINSARFLHLIRDVAQHALRRRTLGNNAKISDARTAVEYLSALMANLPIEKFHALFLDNANAVIADEQLSSGIEDQTPVYPKLVVKRALTLHATGIIVAHNHPTGRLTPSNADREITRALETAAKALDIRLLDHIILGRENEGYFSFREHNLLT